MFDGVNISLKQNKDKLQKHILIIFPQQNPNQITWPHFSFHTTCNWTYQPRKLTSFFFTNFKQLTVIRILRKESLLNFKVPNL